ncbi:MAG: hypothetical protein V7629_06770 [Motiliproteus sp.]
MNRTITLGLALLLVNLGVQANEPSPDMDMDMDMDMDAENTLTTLEETGLGLSGPSVEDYRRCNRDCKTLWSVGMDAERLECVTGCRSVRSLGIMPLLESPE